MQGVHFTGGSSVSPNLENTERNFVVRFIEMDIQRVRYPHVTKLTIEVITVIVYFKLQAMCL